MILEGFEIENWCCLKKVSVSGLPASGVVVIHGPNRTGKSSIVQALRACLMDFPSSSKSSEVTSRFPRGSGEKPVVTVTFRCGGSTYRIQKHFGTGKSELAIKTPAGGWKVETTSAAEAHERTCGLVGGSDSTKGLQQLLWLTQAEFRLPDAKKFDASVQAQLRGILGVLQTPLDDRFIEQVKKRWNVWHSGQRKAGKKAAFKDGCRLAENLRTLEKAKQELSESDNRFQEMEGLLRQAEDLEQAIAELNRQLVCQDADVKASRAEHEQCQARLMAHQQAEQNLAAAQKQHADALVEQRQRADVVQRCQDDEAAVEPAQVAVDAALQRIEDLQKRHDAQRSRVAALRGDRRKLQSELAFVATRTASLADSQRLASLQQTLQHAEEAARQVADVERYLAEHPVPDPKQLAELKENRQEAARLQAECQAAAMQLTLEPQAGAAEARLAMDGSAERPIAAGTAMTHRVQHHATIAIAGWGRLAFRRGSGEGTIDEMEARLRELNERFCSLVGPLGIAGDDPAALDRVLEQIAQRSAKETATNLHKKELKKLAPDGLQAVQAEVSALDAKIAAAATSISTNTATLPATAVELEQRKASLEQQLNDLDGQVATSETGGIAIETELATARKHEIAAKESLAACQAKAKAGREELGRLRSDEAIATQLKQAESALATAESTLAATQLTPRELTIHDRLAAAEAAVRATQSQIGDSSEKFHVIKGRLMDAEGLHARRSALAARVDELTRLTDRESLQRDAIDRLYELFEECRDKQLGTVMGPIHDRVLTWMRVLDIGDYQELRFNEAFLPDRLLRRDGTAEFQVHEESTGAQEQIGMLVRLALGSVLASDKEPTIAILDDPLTHCDAARLNKMRYILRRAAEGDGKQIPHAGPLQILVFTCHPEWFRDERATVVDLECPEVMTRWAG